jgi:hypothetical protein
MVHPICRHELSLRLKESAMMTSRKRASFPGSPTDSLFGWTAHNSLFGETAGDAVPNGRVISAPTGSPPGKTWSRYRSPFLQHDGQDVKRAKTDREDQIREWNAATPSFSMETNGTVDINVSATPFDLIQGPFIGDS